MRNITKILLIYDCSHREIAILNFPASPLSISVGPVAILDRFRARCRQTQSQ